MIALTPVGAAAETCRQALILGLDVSLSVDVFDFALQRGGLARALEDPEVVQALTSPGGHVKLAVFEWSGQFNQTLLLDWTQVQGPETLADMSIRLRDAPQGIRSGRTGLGAAMLFARDQLRRVDCAALTVDISGDGANNNGPRPAEIRQALGAEGITVNALVIEPEAAGPSGLTLYFQDSVITGPGAFTETIRGFNNYEDAIRRKILRETAPAFVQRGTRGRLEAADKKPVLRARHRR
ncbi:DUF1194 domain-containing protein [Roseovarius sp. LXJ103]|uniref:DUF1194 domain-containing protein n=1 Tax=Roseovarius carneus TaxID=2853164 RepID=UPI000D689A37|nr:DUF1194 domain-containing protein [Roseovarius carneus]MBZ8118899.1 DUF1194 domain-containing protein [Roseovarius carneus]